MSGGSPFHERPDGVLIDIVVHPRASTTEVAGIHAGALRVRVAAPPVDGAANEAIVDLFRKRLNVRRDDVKIVSGTTARRKRVLVTGIEAASAHAALVGTSDR